MAWIEIGPDVISELVADSAKHALDDIREETVARRGRPPSFEELLAAMAEALRESGAAPAEGELRAHFSGAPDRTTGGASADHGAVKRLASLFREAVADYQEARGRRPRLSELLETLAFVLRPDPSRYVANRRAGKLDELSWMPP